MPTRFPRRAAAFTGRLPAKSSMFSMIPTALLVCFRALLPIFTVLLPSYAAALPSYAMKLPNFALELPSSGF
jgi:hypothetical protein